MFQCAYLQLRYQHHKLIYYQMLELFGDRNLFTGVAFKFFTVLSLALSAFFCLFTFIDYLCRARTCGPSPAHILHPWTARPVLSPLPFSSLRSFGSSLSSRSLIPLRTWRAWKWLVGARFSLFPYKEMVLKLRVFKRYHLSERFWFAVFAIWSLTYAKQSALSTHLCLSFHFLKRRVWKGCYCIAISEKFIFSYWRYFYSIFKIEYFIVCLWGLMVHAIQLVQVIQEGQVVQLSPCLYFDHAVLE